MKPRDSKLAWQGQSNCLTCPIRDSALFSSLSENDFLQIHDPIDDLRVEIDGMIFAQGDRGHHVFTLRSGFVKLTHLNRDGSHRIVRVIKPGDLFGMEALLGRPYEHQGLALHAAEICRLPVSVIRGLEKSASGFYEQLMGKWGQSLADAERWFSEVNTGRVNVRLARLIAYLSREEQGQWVAPLFKREDMGLMMDAKLETVSRGLAVLEEEGLIRVTDRYHVVIPDLSLLKDYSE